MRRLHANRKYTNLTEIVPEADRKQFSQIIDIKEDGTHALTATFLREIDHAIATAAEARRDS